jgi:two-component system phosphate regulon sensor histidine kinase PhoR
MTLAAPPSNLTGLADPSILSDSGEGPRAGPREVEEGGRAMGGWAWGISGAIVALVALAWATRGVLRCLAVLRELERGLVALGQGRPVRPTNTRAPGPIGRLARTFDGVVPEHQERVGRLGRDVEQLRVVLGGMAEGVIAIDSRRRLLFANKSADFLFGLGPQAVGRLVPELIRSPQFHEAVDATLGGPETYRGEIVLPGREILPRSMPRVLAVHGSMLPGSSPSGAVLVFHDVTELRRLERMRQDFVANVSHELKTPLASIKAYTETLLDWALHDEKVNVRFLNRIEEQADRLDQLILDLLSLARLESGQDAFHHGPLAVSAVVEACIETHRGRAEARALDLRLDLGPVDESTLVVADEEAVHQILDNLVDNAIKYTPEGGWVRVVARLADDSVELEVADSGIGIPRDDLPRIFERFYRVDKARSREMGGTGLGLSIVKHLIQSIGGQISVDSRVGEGTRFTIQLPRYRPGP